MYLTFIVILLSLYMVHLLFYSFNSYVVGIFEQPLAKEFPSGSYLRKYLFIAYINNIINNINKYLYNKLLLLLQLKCLK